MEGPYATHGTPYSSSGSFMDFFEGLTYEHVNFIFADPPYAQESTYPSINASAYKFGLSEPGSHSYYDYCPTYSVGDHTPGNDEYGRNLENFPRMANERTSVQRQQEGLSHANSHATPVECPRSHHNSHDFQVIWQDYVDPDNMTYEELLELGESVGTQSRGLSQEIISLLPISKFKCSFFSRKKSRHERCVICQMEYKRGNRQITLPCKHVYHAGCGSRWLSINKACPICYKDVHVDVSKH